MDCFRGLSAAEARIIAGRAYLPNRFSGWLKSLNAKQRFGDGFAEISGANQSRS